MAVIHFTEADVMATTVAEAGIYPCEVSKVEGPKKSSTGKSNHYFVDITITEGKYKGKTRTIVFNTETNSPSLLGEAQFFPVSYMLQLFAACFNEAAGAGARDTDDLLNKSFDAAWGVATVEGRLINTINSFHPSGYAAGAPAF